ncbi:MAG: uncharacterized protein QOF76_4671 [Solirubrobacteraceae bacterium]|jgi:predicted MPP superfamily phosphohydrolase|nr:uncharacterized protein [Solirubrobacteraceae bacterium]
MQAVAFPEHELRLPRWPARLDGLRVAVVADLHTGGPRTSLPRLDALVERIAASAPDVVALLGDYVDPRVIGGARVRPDAVATRCARLRPAAGVLAVLGNHDWANEGHAMAIALRHAGLRVLEDSAVRLTARGGPLWIAGTGDMRRRGARVGQALAGVPAGEPCLLLSHDPDVFPYVPVRVSLTIAGHLHGGQINLPIPLTDGRIPSRYGKRFLAGHIVEGGRHLFVSRGVGDSVVPLRIRAAPEVPLLILRTSG